MREEKHRRKKKRKTEKNKKKKSREKINTLSILPNLQRTWESHIFISLFKVVNYRPKSFIECRGLPSLNDVLIASS
jgi:hypothetical protein